MGSVTGIVCLDITDECRSFMVIENVIVKSTHRKQGIGRLLMTELEGIGRSMDCKYTMLVSAKHRGQAHRFYEVIGYDLDSVQGFKKYL